MGWGFDDDGPQSALALREAENGVRQARYVTQLIADGLAAPDAFVLTAPTIRELNRLVVEGVVPSAGGYRQRSNVEIAGSRHVIPPHDRVASLVDEACAFVNERREAEAVFLAAYVLWRICWIHPFDDGNGRTARAASYLVLSVRLGLELPGALPVPARLKHAPIAYWRALEAADKASAAGALDVSALERLIAFYLEAQLRDDPPMLPPW